MDVVFGDNNLDLLETDPNFTYNLAQGVVKSYRKRMQLIRASPDERDFYKLKSLRFEKLEGKRKQQHSMWLNDQFRLVIEFIERPQDKVVKIIGIEDYH